MVEADAQLQLKKRARRRLVGATAFAGLAAVILPMVMDQEPKPPKQDVEIRIPGQDEKPFAPKFATAPAPAVAPAVAPTPSAPVAATPAPAAPVAATVAPPAAAAVTPPPPPASKPAAEPSVRVVEKSIADKPVEKAPPKPVEKPAPVKPVEKADTSSSEAQRAAAILSGKSFDPAPAAPAHAAAGNGAHLLLIGAYTNPGHVQILQKKLGEMGIKVITEKIDSPQGAKTRVRAGPFPNRDAAEKAAEKLKRIGVTGVVAPAK
ncbi:MAG: hypothetical protein RIR00_2674 [Pseudomonadota bacterium]|jgi:DedD protein